MCCRLPVLVLATLVLAVAVGGDALGLHEGDDTTARDRWIEAKQEPPTEPESKAFPHVSTAWNLEKVNDLWKPAFVHWQEGKLEAALEHLEELRKRKGDERLESDDRKKVEGLRRLASDLVDCDKVLEGKRFSRKHLAALRDSSRKYHNTFAYFMFLERESAYRKQWVKTVTDFEPTLTVYNPYEDPIDPFDAIDYSKIINVQSSAHSMEHAIQGHFAYRWEETPEKRGLAPDFSPGETDWTPYRYLCLSARLDDPSKTLLSVNVWAGDRSLNYFEIGLGTWRGWKHFVIDFKKVGVARKRNPNVELSWKSLRAIQFVADGGGGSFVIDDVYLCR